MNLKKCGTELFSKNIRFTMAIIIKKTGSAPRGVGATMIITKDEEFGTIGGGAVEYQATILGRKLLKENKITTHNFILAKNDVEDLGMVCGGTNEVLFFIPKDERDFLKIASGKCALSLESSEIIEIGHDGDFKEVDGKKYFNYRVDENANVYLFGGGHVSRKMAEILKFLSMNVTVVEDRENFLEHPSFDGVNKIHMEMDKIDLPIESCDYVLIMTRGHKFDNEVLRQVLPYNPRYLGVIGSRKKVKMLHDNMKTWGYEDKIKDVHAPIGFDIGAETPEEIAISIAAEMIEIKRKK